LRVKNIVDVLSLLDKSDLTLKELITVPQGKHDLGDNLLDTGFLEPERFSTDNRRVNHIQSKRVRTVTLHDQGRVGIGFQSLRHLLAVFSEDNSVHDTVLEREFTEQMSSQDGQGIEPTTGLVQTFRDEITRETLLKLLLVFEWVVLRRIRHASRLK